jgi:hypothetical protein
MTDWSNNFINFMMNNCEQKMLISDELFLAGLIDAMAI